jgi:hypothetical protein
MHLRDMSQQEDLNERGSLRCHKQRTIFFGACHLTIGPPEAGDDERERGK